MFLVCVGMRKGVYEEYLRDQISLLYMIIKNIPYIIVFTSFIELIGLTQDALKPINVFSFKVSNNQIRCVVFNLL